MMEPPQPCPCPRVTLTVPSVTGSLPIVRAVVEKMAEATGIDAKSIAAISLAIDEAVANVIKHSYDGAPGMPIDVCVELTSDRQGDALAITIRDYGRQVAPAQIQSRDLDDVRPGGLGVHIIRSVMDGAEYAQADGGGMILRMVKRVGGGTGPAEPHGRNG